MEIKCIFGALALATKETSIIPGDPLDSTLLDIYDSREMRRNLVKAVGIKALKGDTARGTL